MDPQKRGWTFGLTVCRITTAVDNAYQVRLSLIIKLNYKLFKYFIFFLADINLFHGGNGTRSMSRYDAKS